MSTKSLNSIDIAQLISSTFSPYRVTFVLLLVVSFLACERWIESLWWIAISFATCLILPNLVLAHLRRQGQVSDLDVSYRQERTKLKVVLGAMTVVCLPAALTHLTKSPLLLRVAFTTYPVGFIFGYVCTHVWKVSGHVSSISVAITLMVLVSGAKAGVLIPLVPIVAWARVHTQAHSIWETICGAFLGTLSTFLVWNWLH